MSGPGPAAHRGSAAGRRRRWLLAPGDTGEYAELPGADVPGTADTVVPVRWGGRIRRQYAQDPPYLVPSRVPGERVLSRFPDGAVNALVRPYHRGAVGVVGTHPEADRSWYTDRLWRADTDGPDHREGLGLVAALLRVRPPG